MPQKGAAKNATQRKRITERRLRWILDNGPCALCGSWKQLEIDHIDPTTKDPTLKRRNGVSAGSRLWNRSDNRRTVELLKCQVLCRLCHLRKTAAENRMKETCKQGHVLATVGVYVRPNGSQNCRECRRLGRWRTASSTPPLISAT